MKNEKTVTETVTRTIMEGVGCDRCGKDMTNGPITNYSWEGTTFEVSFGYGSCHDCTNWEFELCDDCCDWLAGEVDVRKTIW